MLQIQMFPFTSSWKLCSLRDEECFAFPVCHKEQFSVICIWRVDCRQIQKQLSDPLQHLAFLGPRSRGKKVGRHTCPRCWLTKKETTVWHLATDSTPSSCHRSSEREAREPFPFFKIFITSCPASLIWCYQLRMGVNSYLSARYNGMIASCVGVDLIKCVCRTGHLPRPY